MSSPSGVPCKRLPTYYLLIRYDAASMAVTFKDGVILGKKTISIWFCPLPPTTAVYLFRPLKSRRSHQCCHSGADSRTTTGAYIANRVTDKLTRVHDTIWCCRSGSAADTQAVADIVQYQLGLFSMHNGKPPTTQTAAAIFQEICYENKDRLRYVPSFPPSPPLPDITTHLDSQSQANLTS